MSNNQTIKIGSKVDVIIKVKSERTINGVKYVINQPYTILNGASANFGFNNVNPYVNTVRGHEISDIGSVPDSITIGNFALTSKIMDLLFVGESAAKKTRMIRILDSSFYIDAGADNLFFFDKNGDCKDNTNNAVATYDSATGKCEVESSLIGGLLFYDLPQNGYSFVSPHNSYFEIDLIGKGNIEEGTNDFYIQLPTCALVPQKSFVFSPNSMNRPTLYFNIMNVEAGKILVD